MIYVTSDLHGCSPSVLEALLAKAGFGSRDFLYVLGDVIDRGKHGAELLLWLTEQPNVQLILGNHESMLLSCKYLFEEISVDSLRNLNMRKLRLYHHWKDNGGEPTIRGLKRLLRQSPELLEGIWDYLYDAPLYEELMVNGRDFVLVHSGIDHFQPDKPLEDYDAHDLLWARPALTDVYFPDRTTVFGHTPVQFLTPDSPDRAIRTDSWICIDTGAACGRTPMLLRLEDLREFYL